MQALASKLRQLTLPPCFERPDVLKTTGCPVLRHHVRTCSKRRLLKRLKHVNLFFPLSYFWDACTHANSNVAIIGLVLFTGLLWLRKRAQLALSEISHRKSPIMRQSHCVQNVYSRTSLSLFHTHIYTCFISVPYFSTLRMRQVNKSDYFSVPLLCNSVLYSIYTLACLPL